MRRFFRLFRIGLLSEKRAVLRIFGVFLLAFSGFLTVRELTENVTLAVSKEIRPFFWSDVAVVKNEFVPPERLTEIIANATSTSTKAAIETTIERYDFDATFFDRSGGTGLVKVVAFSGSYPLYGTFSTVDGPMPGGVAMASESVRERFMSGGTLSLGGIELAVGKIITESNETSFSFGNEGHLIVVPHSALSGSELFSKEARITSTAAFKTKNATDAETLYQRFRNDAALSAFRVRSFERNSDRTLDTVEDLSRYVLLVLVSWALFAGIVILNANATFLAAVSRNFTILELLWLPKREKWILLTTAYAAVIGAAFALSLPISYAVIRFAAGFEGARGFEFLWGPVWFSAGIGAAITLATVPASSVVFAASGLFLWLFIIFENPLWALVASAGILSFATLLPRLAERTFAWAFGFALSLRETRFFAFDGMRTVVRPLVPSGLIALCAVSAFSVLLAFLLVSSTFRERLETSSKDDVRIYALNILPKDRVAVEKEFPNLALFSIIRGRILAVNGKSLSEHLAGGLSGGPSNKPTGESGRAPSDGPGEPPRQFSREFNITTTPVPNSKILEWETTLGSDGVSVDEAFAKELGIDIGDQVRFSIGGREFALRVKNLRESKREGFRPFFYFQVEEAAFSNAPKTYFAPSTEENVESFKKRLLSVTGQHVTFVDVTAILAIASAVSEKILAVVGLFLAFVGVFAFLAILTLFSTFWPLLQTKAFVYRLFGATAAEVGRSAQISVSVLLIFGATVSTIIGTGTFFFALERFSFLKFSWSAFGTGAAFFILAWFVLSAIVLWNAGVAVKGGVSRDS